MNVVMVCVSVHCSPPPQQAHICDGGGLSVGSDRVRSSGSRHVRSAGPQQAIYTVTYFIYYLTYFLVLMLQLIYTTPVAAVKSID